MLAYIQAPNMYFDITAYIHAKGMYYCVSRYLYMGYEVLEYVPGSPITRYVRYPDSLVPNTYATPPVTGYLERPLPGMPITQYILAPAASAQSHQNSQCGIRSCPSFQNDDILP